MTTTDPVLEAAVRRAAGLQGVLYKGLGGAGAALGLAMLLGGLLGKVKPGDEGAMRVVALFGLVLLAAGVGLWRYAAISVGRLRRLLLDAPVDVASFELVELRRGRLRLWAVRFVDRAGKRAGLNVGSEAEARDLIARVKARGGGATPASPA